LAKILFSESVALGSNEVLLAEGIASVTEAIAIERRRNRSSVHPYVVLFQGMKSLVNVRSLRESDFATVRARISEAKRKFPRDTEVKTLIDEVEAILA
jgi:hypothetical protein